MNLIDEEYYNTRFPGINNQSFDNFTEEEKEKFLYEYSLYCNWLNKYVFENTILKEKENLLYNNNEFSFPEIKEEDKDIYQFLATGISKYFYVRNNICLDNIGDSISFLRDRISSENVEYDSEAKEFIERTFKKVIYEKVSDKTDEKRTINYGPDSSSDFFASNDDLVIGFRYNYYVKSLETQEEYDKYLERDEYLYELLEDISSTITKELNINTSVITYNEDSVKIKNISETSKLNL